MNWLRASVPYESFVHILLLVECFSFSVGFYSLLSSSMALHFVAFWPGRSSAIGQPSNNVLINNNGPNSCMQPAFVCSPGARFNSTIYHLHPVFFFVVFFCSFCSVSVRVIFDWNVFFVASFFVVVFFMAASFALCVCMVCLAAKGEGAPHQGGTTLNTELYDLRYNNARVPVVYCMLIIFLKRLRKIMLIDMFRMRLCDCGTGRTLCD